ncbi:MAG: formate dehydrogenase accessory sulfurtransferase FdhD [Deltaproteobacteria bacterium]|nr:formate dehydrogenase accessory sulfurtransferase FdhD [Deltaproteobacteria bacterium]
MNNSASHLVVRWEEAKTTRQQVDLLEEEPLSIRIQGNPYSVVMRTPGEEIAHVAGFCLGEGIIDSPQDYTSIAFCEREATNVATVTLTPARREMIAAILDRRNYISQSSCGLCGKELVQDLYQSIRPVPDGVRMGLRQAMASLNEMAANQPVRDRTRASHAAALCDRDGNMLCVAEDVGRHNALDKAIGMALLDGRLPNAALAVLSSRVSYEMVQKTARARIPMIFAVSRPTALAVELSARLNMGLACLAERAGAYVFCGGSRFVMD